MVRRHPAKPDADMPPLLARVSDYVTYGAATFPHRSAFIFDGRHVTYRALDEKLDAIAAAMIASGVNNGDRIATLAPPSPEFFEVFLAAASIGAIWIGLNPKYAPRELAHLLRDAEPTLILTRPDIGGRSYLDELKRIASDLLPDTQIHALPHGASDDAWISFLDRGREVSRETQTTRKAAVDADDVCLIVYTSGTTGAPKGAMLTHKGLVYCSHTDARYNLDSGGQRILCNFPVNHIACVGDVCMTTLVVGGTIVFMESFDPRGVLQTIEREKITHLGQIPAMLQMEFGVEEFNRYDLSSLRQVIWGGNPASIDLIRRLRATCPNLVNVYGMTETTGNIIFARGPGFSDEALASSIGFAPPEYEVGIFTGDNEPAGPDEVGEIYARGPFVMRGYWNNETATRGAFTDDGWLRTGDLAKKDAKGRIAIAGRRTEMYKSGGYNIYPAEIEQVMETHQDVAMAAVVNAPDPLYSEVGVAFILAKSEKPTVTSLQEHCRENLANYKIPKHIVFVEVMPMLPTGKVDRKHLKALARNIGS